MTWKVELCTIHSYFSVCKFLKFISHLKPNEQTKSFRSILLPVSVVIVFLVPSNYWLFLLFSEEDVAYKHQERFVSLLKKKRIIVILIKSSCIALNRCSVRFFWKGRTSKKRIKNNAFFVLIKVFSLFYETSFTTMIKYKIADSV